MDDISLEEGLDFLASVGMDIKVADEEGIKDYIVLEPDCIQCGEPILKPADCNMELFRYGAPLHNGCVEAWEKATGLEYRDDPD